jgi:cellulose synthase/poly-beta-1,6-N-acetylglucosamine synthase-like glycosyltransferase
MQLDYKNFEVILLPDEATENLEGTKIISTGPVTPGKKRNIGIANSAGEICAFIDSDAYPRRDWLKNAVKNLEDPEIAAVGGPGLTPEGDSLMQKAGGLVLSSFMVGSLSKRYDSKNACVSDDIHSCNFVARKSVLADAGGWNEKYWPGEDTLICRAIKSLGKKSIEAPDVVVYHHRHSLFKPHLKQVSRFGEHRGFFVKKFPENSVKLTYFLPTLLIFSLIIGMILSMVFPLFAYVMLFGVSTYLFLGLSAAIMQVKNPRLLLSVWLGIIATHVVYGFFFLSGIVKRDLSR